MKVKLGWVVGVNVAAACLLMQVPRGVVSTGGAFFSWRRCNDVRLYSDSRPTYS